MSTDPKSAYRGIHNFFVNDSLRNILLNRGLMNYVQSLDDIDEETMNQGDIAERISQIPRYIDQYHSFYPLDQNFWSDNSIQEIDFAFGQSFRVIDSASASPCCLRRISEHQILSIEQALTSADPWFKIKHPNIVSLKQVISTDQFGNDNDLLFIYDYSPGAETLEEHFFIETSRAPAESTLWSLICQCLSALREIHSKNLAYRTFYTNKIIILPGLTNKRFKLNCSGMLDILENTEEADIAAQQKEDFKHFGILLVELMCTFRELSDAPHALSVLNNSESISCKYSTELVDFVKTLLQDDIDLNKLISNIALRYVDELSTMYNYVDTIENELAKELENGRLFRLLVKLNFVAQHEE
ncbi:predicted protein [Naegleria gruberi]|uniref:Predicted protein n=1 Tax=Naegleria gruberi TaxID=5762 RepID=D2VV16_NAEGR|nr:uncharacterized protein NAEGRDRAFT_52485 [Naegleria gruberi]EFC39362.1 predicted protein [Naegleria gruberi]|eukprot:XP_002672106.1 predicted protein [Naegleria gruberi strain NEG-M]